MFSTRFFSFFSCILLSFFLSLISTAQEERSPSQVTLTDFTCSFYVSEWQVEKEYLIRPLTLQSLEDFGFSKDSNLTPEQREALVPKILRFLKDKCPTTIDGESVNFHSEGLQFISPNPKSFELIDPASEVGMQDFVISAVFTAPIPSIKSKLSTSWDLFPPDMDTLPIRIADSVGTRVIKVTPASPLIEIKPRLASNVRHRDLTVPPVKMQTQQSFTKITVTTVTFFILCITYWISTSHRRIWAALTLCSAVILLISIPTAFPKAHIFPLNKDDSKDLAQTLLQNIYHSFHLKDESEQYDALGTVISGEALTDTYLEFRRIQEDRKRAGTRVQVQKVKVLETQAKPLDSGTYQINTQWKTFGKIGHWGHFHRRLNTYSATLTVSAQNNTWRISHISLIDRERETTQ